MRADPTRPRRLLPVLEAVRRQGRPDVIHVHWTEPYIAAAAAVSRAQGQRTLLELRSPGAPASASSGPPTTSSATTARRTRRAALHARRSSSCRRGHRPLRGGRDALVAALELAAGARRKVAVIPHGHYRGAYPDTMSRAEARQRLGLPPDARVVAFVGWVRAYKGVAELVEAFSGVDAPAARLVIAGQAVDDAYAERIARLAAADPRVRLDLGFVPDDELQVYLRAADVVATPFLEILTSGSVLLAMSFGRAVIAPRRGCVAETLDDAGGLLYDPDDPAGLKERCGPP